MSQSFLFKFVIYFNILVLDITVETFGVEDIQDRDVEVLRNHLNEDETILNDENHNIIHLDEEIVVDNRDTLNLILQSQNDISIMDINGDEGTRFSL